MPRLIPPVIIRSFFTQMPIIDVQIQDMSHERLFSNFSRLISFRRLVFFTSSFAFFGKLGHKIKNKLIKELSRLNFLFFHRLPLGIHSIFRYRSNVTSFPFKQPRSVNCPSLPSQSQSLMLLNKWTVVKDLNQKKRKSLGSDHQSSVSLYFVCVLMPNMFVMEETLSQHRRSTALSTLFHSKNFLSGWRFNEFD